LSFPATLFELHSSLLLPLLSQPSYWVHQFHGDERMRIFRERPKEREKEQTEK
jgi:hypothetical protein